MMQFVVLTELRVIFPIPYLTSVISKHFVKEQITVLKSSYMNRDDGNALLKQGLIGEEKVCCDCDT